MLLYKTIRRVLNGEERWERVVTPLAFLVLEVSLLLLVVWSVVVRNDEHRKDFGITSSDTEIQQISANKDYKLP